MANENMIQFLRGSVANLPQNATEGALYFTKDEGIYLGMADGSYHRYGDFITVADVKALPTDGAHATCMYYCTAENILARYDSAKGWIQINKQPTAEEMKTLLGLGDLADLSEVTENNLGKDLAEKINNKVDKVTGKSLVDDEEITKLAGVSAGANKVENVGDGKIKIDGEEVTVYAHPKKHAIAEVDGLETALAGLQEKGDYAAEEHEHFAADITDLDDTIKNYGYATQEYVGEIPTDAEGNPLAISVIGYINKKTDGIATSGNLEALGERVTANEGKIAAINNEETGILAQAKAYVDEEDKFYNGIETVNGLGGIGGGTSLDGKTTHEIIDMLLFPYVAPSITKTSRTAAATTLENGAEQTLSSCSITVAKKSKAITKISLYNGSTLLDSKEGDAVANGGTFTFNGFDAITVNKSNNPNLKFVVDDESKASAATANVGASTFVYPYYWGVCAKGATIDEALVEGLTKSIQSKANSQAVTYDCDNQCMVFAYPHDTTISGLNYGNLVSILDPNNFETIGGYTKHIVSITGLDGKAVSYNVYVSGAGSATGFKVTYKLVK